MLVESKVQSPKSKISSRLDRRSLRLARRDGVVHRDDALRAELAVFRQQGVVRHAGSRVSSHLRIADGHPELLVPVIIQNVLARKAIPVYGDGMNVRDWLYVRDHAEALWTVLQKGQLGETYNIGGHNEWANLRIVELICDTVDEFMPQPGGGSRKLISFVKDRAGHDRRYAIDATKIQRELGWTPAHQFEQGIRETIRWYLDHQAWIKTVTA